MCGGKAVVDIIVIIVVVCLPVYLCVSLPAYTNMIPEDLRKILIFGDFLIFWKDSKPMPKQCWDDIMSSLHRRRLHGILQTSIVYY